MKWTIEGDPVGKMRQRARGIKTADGGVTARTYLPDKTKAGKPTSKTWEKEAAIRIATAGPFQASGPFVVTVDAVKTRTKALQAKKHPDGRIVRTTKPDGDNVLKSVCDALEKAGVVKNDAQFADKQVRSWYAARGEEAKVEIEVVPWPRPVCADLVWCVACGQSATTGHRPAQAHCPFCGSEVWPLSATDVTARLARLNELEAGSVELPRSPMAVKIAASLPVSEADRVHIRDAFDLLLSIRTREIQLKAFDLPDHERRALQSMLWVACELEDAVKKP
jgi:Holliday junction resolvase RusA-like endonuclease